MKGGCNREGSNGCFGCTIYLLKDVIAYINRIVKNINLATTHSFLKASVTHST